MAKPTVVILAAGQNSRFFPFNTDVHKEAITLLGESLLARTLRSLDQHHYQKVIIVVSPQPEQTASLKQIIASFTHSLQIELVTQAQPLGMGDAVLSAKHLLGEQFAVIRPGLLEAGEILDNLLATNEKNVLCGMPTQEPWLYGIFKLAGDRAQALVEKPKPGEEPSNIKVEIVYLLSDDYLKILADTPQAEYAFEASLNTLMQQQPIKVVTFDHEPPTMKLPWHLFTFQKYLFSQLKSHRGKNINLATTAVIDEAKGPVWIEDDVKIGHCSRIVGPCYLGRGVIIGDFNLIRESSIEAGSKIGSHTDLTRSIIMEKTSLHYSYVGDSIIGSGINIGAGLITGNYRLDKQTVKVTVKGQKVDSQLRKLGVLIGSHANLGIGIRTMPGVCIGANSLIFPSQTVFTNVDHRATLK